MVWVSPPLFVGAPSPGSAVMRLPLDPPTIPPEPPVPIRLKPPVTELAAAPAMSLAAPPGAVLPATIVSIRVAWAVTPLYISL